MLAPGDRLDIEAMAEGLAPRGPAAMRVLHAGGSVQTLAAIAAVETEFELALLRAGGMVPSILQRCLGARA